MPSKNKDEIHAPFSLINLNKPTSFLLFKSPEITFNGHPAVHYLQDDKAQSTQQYFFRRLGEETFKQGKVAHLALDLQNYATQFQYTSKPDGPIHTATIVKTAKAFPDRPPQQISRKYTLIDQELESEARVGGFSKDNSGSRHYNFIVIGEHPLDGDPQGLFIWIHPNTIIHPDKVWQVPYDQLQQSDTLPAIPIVRIEEPTTDITPTPAQPSKQITKTEEHVVTKEHIAAEKEENDGWDFSLLFKDLSE